MKQPLVSLILLVTACARIQQAEPTSPAAGRPVTTEADAVAVVVADIQRRGGNPRREEISATKREEDWWVTAWHIWYPRNVGASRFVPGGFTTYVLRQDGTISKVVPGH